MHAIIFLLATQIITAPGAAANTGDAPILRLAATIPLSDVSGRIDHLAVDPTGKHLFVAALGNNTVEIVDLDQGKRTGRIEGVREPQGVWVIPGSGTLESPTRPAARMENAVHTMPGNGLSAPSARWTTPIMCATTPARKWCMSATGRDRWP